MKTKEEYYESVLENRRIVSDPNNTACPCPSTLCEWHGRCRDCVALHRYHGEHVPRCLQPILKDKIKALASAAELYTNEKNRTPDEYWLYVRERDSNT
jgi:hypothetical protein